MKCWASGSSTSTRSRNVAFQRGSAQFGWNAKFFIPHTSSSGLKQAPTSSGVDEHHGRLRFTWRMEGADGSTIIEGIDFGELADDGRLQRSVGFFGPRPDLS